MATLQEMLSLNGGSFQKAEQMALDRIVSGQPDVWLDLSLLLQAQGKIDGARQALAEHLKAFPGNLRARHVETWFRLYDGDLQGGLEHIAVGHMLGTLPTEVHQFTKPEWNGQDLNGRTILIVAEGGQGDQIMTARAAQWLAERWAKVVMSASESLVPLLAGCKYLSAVIPKQAAHLVYHDYWTLGLACWAKLDRTWETLWTGKYISARDVNPLWSAIVPRTPGILNVGIRWAGDQQFEHVQLRRFPPELMFALASVPNCRFYSLQRDDPSTELPHTITNLEPFLSSWEQTAAAVSRMDVVISSCTSVAHLAAGMGQRTWVVVPAMPYYPWARPGRQSDWYPSATVYRQKCYGEWAEPFAEIRKDLEGLSCSSGV